MLHAFMSSMPLAPINAPMTMPAWPPIASAEKSAAKTMTIESAARRDAQRDTAACAAGSAMCGRLLLMSSIL